MSSKAPGDDDLVRQALGGLFAIATEDRPPTVTEALQEQIETLPAAECRRLVEQMVDTQRLASMVEAGATDPPTGPPSVPDDRTDKVDRALEPLVALTCGEEGTRSLREMQDEQRLHLLFSSLGPGGPGQTSAAHER